MNGLIDCAVQITIGIVIGMVFKEKIIAGFKKLWSKVKEKIGKL